MAKLDEQFIAGGGGGISKDNYIKIQTVEGDEKITTKNEDVLRKQKIKLLSFLIKEGFLREQDDGYVMKKEMLDDPGFKQRLSRLYLGRNSENKTVFGGLRRMGNLLRGLKIKTEQDNLNVANNNKGRWGVRSFGEIFDEKYGKRTLKEKVFDILKKEGIVEQIGDDIIVNVKDLKRVKFWQTQRGSIFRTKEFNIRFTPINIYKILGDIKVISREEYEEWALSGVKPEAKPLFNIPEDMDDAFNIENIKNKRYHLDVWEMYKNVPWGIIDILTKDGNSIGGRELYLAIKIFRDLQGQRGKDGVLKIFDQNKNTFVKISNQKLIELGVITGVKSIRKILAESCHNLLASGIIRFDDFGIITNSDSGEIFRKEFISTNSRSVFKVMINSVNYYIGRKFFIYRDEKIPIKNIKIVVLDKKNGGVVRMYEGREELIYTFRLLDDNEIKEKRNKVNKKYNGRLTENQISARVGVNKRELDLRMKKYSVTEIVPKKDNETPEEYGDRIGNLPDYGYVQKVTKKLSEKIGVGIHNLDWREQLQVATMEYETGVVSNSKDFIKFADRYKLNGLRTFLSLEKGGEEMGEKILQIGDAFKDSPELAMQIFAQYASMVDSIDSQVEEMSEMYESMFYKKSISKEQLVEKILKDSTNVLLQVNDDIRDVKDVTQKREIVQNLIIDLKRIDDVNKKNIQNVTEVYKKLDDLKKDFIYKVAQDNPDSLLRHVLGDYEKYKTPQELNKAIESGEIEAWWMDNKWRQPDAVEKEIDYIANKMDGYVIRNIISTLKEEIDEKEEYLRRGLDTPDYEAYYKKVIVDNKRAHPGLVHTDLVSFKRYMDIISKNKEQIKKMEEILELQDNFEKLFDGIIYGDDKQIFENSSISAQVMQKYQELIEEAKRSKDEIAELFVGESELTDEELNNISGNMIKKAKDLLDDFIEQINTTENIDESVMSQKLNNLKADIELFKATFKNARQNGLISIEQMKDLQTLTLTGKELQSDEHTIQIMREIYAQNYEKYPKLQEILVNSIDKKLQDPNTEFHFVRYIDTQTNEEVISFLTTKTQEDGSIYFGSFNTNNDVYGGASLGLALAEEVFAKKENEGIKKIEAHSIPQEGINNIYINRYHFIADDIVENYENSGVDLFHITRKKENNNYFYQNETNNEILKKDIINSIEQIDDNTERFIIRLQKTNILEISKQLFEKGFVLTKYDIDKETGDIYCGFEKEMD